MNGCRASESPAILAPTEPVVGDAGPTGNRRDRRRFVQIVESAGEASDFDRLLQTRHTMRGWPGRFVMTSLTAGSGTVAYARVFSERDRVRLAWAPPWSRRTRAGSARWGGRAASRWWSVSAGASNVSPTRSNTVLPLSQE